ncbi:MAG: MazG nucleotide pyrophosphohydrolase domain-containing protein [bacterium]
MDTYSKLTHIVDILNQRFGNSNPFQIITRLAEETGELAEQVNHFENSGVKKEKHGLPDKAKMAKEIQDVMRCAIQVMKYYNLENDVEESIENSYQKVCKA